MTPAEWIWIISGALLLAVDGLLVKSGREPLTRAARRHRWITIGVFALLGFHFLDVLGPLDPFSFLGDLLD